MAKMKVKGLEEWSTKLEELGEAAYEVMAAAVYAGAGVAADAIKAAIDTIPEQQGYMRGGNKRRSATRSEKEDLKNAIGIASFDKTGGDVTTAVGFEGYSSHKTVKYPNGTPLPMIARSIEGGSSVREAFPFMRRATQKCKEEAHKAMEKAALDKIREIMEG